jgi:hypothetical protein
MLAWAYECVVSGRGEGGAPGALDGRCVDEGLQLRRERGQVQEEVTADLGQHRHRGIQLGLGVDELRRVEQGTARVALVAARVLVLALRACALYEAVREEPELLAPQLRHL